jgi:hypothetical protein
MQLSPERWLELAAEHGTPHVTLTLPLEHEAITDEKNRLGWRNLVDEAERQLERFGMEPEARRTLLAPARDLLRGPQVGAEGARALVMLLSRDRTIVHWCDHPLPMAARVSDRFDLSALLDHLLPEPEVHVLGLSDKGARLLRCTPHEVEEIVLPSAPPSLDAATAIDVEIENRGGRTAHAVNAGGGASGAASGVKAARGRGAVSPSLHVQGFGYRDRRHDQLETWLRAVHKGIHQDVGRMPSPLVLACTERVHGMWREIFGEDACAPQYLSGNPQLMDEEAIRAEALKLMAEALRTDPQPWVDRYWIAKRDQKTTTDLDEVLRACADQRVDTLFVRRDRPKFGRVLDDGRVLDLQVGDPGAVDLTAQAVVQTLLQGGRVIEVEQLPEAAEGTTCTAILRW